jgi:hypothetical protein
MRCKECGESAQEPTLRYCENCGAKMPPPPPGTPLRRPPPGGAVRSTGSSRSTGTARAMPARDESEDTDPGLRAVHAEDADEHTDPGRPASPPYGGPAWLAHVPGHSPSVAGVGLLAVGLVLSILPFFAGVGPFWSLVVFAGGWLVVARELRAAGEQHPLVDWVPPSLLRPEVPAVYAAVTVGLAIRMLGIGLTPLLWLGGAGLLAYDQYGKVYVGPEGVGRYFEPRQLLRGMAPVALAGVVLCLLALFLTWESATGSRYSGSGPVPQGPPELRVVDVPRPSSDSVYSMFDDSYDKGWDQTFAVTLELLLLAVLGLMALRPEVPRPEWLRFAPIGVVVFGLLWTVVQGGLLLGPMLFVVGLAALGFGSMYPARG